MYHDPDETKDPVRSPFKKGDRVRLKKGCAIKFTTRRNASPVVGKTMVIVVVRVATGYKGMAGRQTCDDEVVWVGASGYWFHSSDFANMELVTP